MAKGLGKGLDELFKDTGEAYEHMFDGKDAFGYTEEERKNAEDCLLYTSDAADDRR